MTRMLIVDDDPNQVRVLARVVSLRQPSLSVVTANSGAHAIEVLRSMPIDLVLTDLQMPDMNGFELTAWLLMHQPHVQVFTMTAFPDDEAVDRLRALGSVECYTKPLDVAQVLERLSITLAQGMRGHVRNISLPSLLQMLEMEQKTCTLAVESGGRHGYLYMQDGALIDARLDGVQGDEAAIEIAGWRSSAVTIINTCATKQRTVERPMGFIIMEAARLLDEAERWQKARDAGAGALEPRERSPHEEPASDPETIDLRSLSRFPAPTLSASDAIAIIEPKTGRIHTRAGAFEGLDALAQLAAKVYANEAAVVEQMGIGEAIAEIVVTTERYWTMTRPLRTEPPTLALLVFDPQRANVVLERLELEAFVHALESWSSQRRERA
jgi:CheY-like chemotaxis protein